ncbi:MAG: HIT family protein [Chloroflexota bacterium]
MESLWAPWRAAYITGAKSGEEGGCILCVKPEQEADEENLILHRGSWNFIMLNAYPYNPGHLMVAPYRHVPDPRQLTQEELAEHASLVNKALSLLESAMRPSSFNVGMNLGRSAGAGIADHMHTHVVPRWQGDNNFMPVISNTRVLSEGLPDTYRKLKEALSA